MRTCTQCKSVYQSGVSRHFCDRCVRESPELFRGHLLVQTSDGVRPFSKVAADFQRKDFAALDAGWRRAVGQDIEGIQRGYLERSRGASKTLDLSIMSAYALWAAEHQVKGLAVATDRDQARLLRDSLAKLCRINPWLDSILECQSNRCLNRSTGSELIIESSDSSSLFGHTCQFIIGDELVHWQSYDSWDAFISTLAKDKRCIVVLISNAGFGKGDPESWTWAVREEARVSPDWFFSRLEKPAPWITAAHLREQARLLSPPAYKRLYENHWTSGMSDVVTEEDLARALVLRGPTLEPEGEYLCVGGIDGAYRRDWCSLVVVGVHVGNWSETEKPLYLSRQEESLIDAGLLDEPEQEWETNHVPATGNVKLVMVRTWKPDGRDIDLEEVEQFICSVHERFGLQMLSYDPNPMEPIAQRLRKAGVPAVGVYFTPSNCTQMVNELCVGFSEGRLQLFDEPDLIRDLGRVQVKETAQGSRLYSKRGVTGHCDVAMAYALSLLAARESRRVEVPYFEGELICE